MIFAPGGGAASGGGFLYIVTLLPSGRTTTFAPAGMAPLGLPPVGCFELLLLAVGVILVVDDDDVLVADVDSTFFGELGAAAAALALDDDFAFTPDETDAPPSFGDGSADVFGFGIIIACNESNQLYYHSFIQKQDLHISTLVYKSKLLR